MHFYNSVRFVCNPRNFGGSGVRLPGAKFDKYETPDYNVASGAKRQTGIEWRGG